MIPDPALNRRRLQRKLGLVCVMLCVTAGLTLATVATSTKTFQGKHAESVIPRDLPPEAPVWHGIDEPMSQRILDILKTNDCLSREYRRAGLPFGVYLVVVYSERNRKGVHPPKVCLQGAGDLALKETPVRIAGVGPNGGDLDALEMITQRGTARTHHLYFYKCGDVFTSSFLKQQFVIWMNGLRSRNASGALIRFSAPILGNDEETTRRAVQDLLAATMPHIRDRL